MHARAQTHRRVDTDGIVESHVLPFITQYGCKWEGSCAEFADDVRILAQNMALGDDDASKHSLALLDDEAVVQCALSLGADTRTHFSARIVDDGALKICPVKLLAGAAVSQQVQTTAACTEAASRVSGAQGLVNMMGSYRFASVSTHRKLEVLEQVLSNVSACLAQGKEISEDRKSAGVTVHAYASRASAIEGSSQSGVNVQVTLQHAVGGLAGAHKVHELGREVSQRTLEGMLHEDAMVVVCKTTEVLNARYRDGGAKALLAVQQMHVALCQASIQHTKEVHKESKRQKTETAALDRMPTQSQIRDEFKAWVDELVKVVYKPVLDWVEADGPFPAELLNRKHLKDMLKHKAPHVYRFVRPMAVQRSFRDYCGEKRGAEVERRMAMATKPLLNIARIHSERLATEHARFQTLLALAHRVNNPHSTMTTADRETENVSGTRKFMRSRSVKGLSATKELIEVRKKEGDIIASYVDNCTIEMRLKLDTLMRTEANRRDARDFTVAGLLDPHDQFRQLGNGADRTPRFVCTAPCDESNAYYRQTIYGIEAGAQFATFDRQLAAADASSLVLQPDSHPVTRERWYKSPEGLEFVGFNIPHDLMLLGINAGDVDHVRRMQLTTDKTEKKYEEGILDTLLERETAASSNSPGALAGCEGRAAWPLPPWESGTRAQSKRQSPASWEEGSKAMKRPRRMPVPVHPEAETTAVGYLPIALRHSGLLASGNNRGTGNVDENGFGKPASGGWILGCDGLTAMRHWGLIADACEALFAGFVDEGEAERALQELGNLLEGQVELGLLHFLFHLIQITGGAKRAWYAFWKPVLAFLGRAGIDFNKEAQKVDAKRDVLLLARRAIGIVLLRRFGRWKHFPENAIWGVLKDGGSTSTSADPQRGNFDRAAHTAGFKAFLKEQSDIGDPDFDLIHSVFLQSTEVGGFSFFCARGIFESVDILRKRFLRRWGPHKKWHQARNELKQHISRLFRSWRANRVNMAHTAWALTGNFESQSVTDVVQEEDVAASKALLPKNLPPKNYFSVMCDASLNGQYLHELRKFAVPALCGKAARRSRGTARSTTRKDIDALVDLIERSGAADPSEHKASVTRDRHFSSITATAAAVPVKLPAAYVRTMRSECLWKHGSGQTQGLTVLASSDIKMKLGLEDGRVGVGAALMAVHVHVPLTEEPPQSDAASVSSLSQADADRLIDSTLERKLLPFFCNETIVNISDIRDIQILPLNETNYLHPTNAAVIIAGTHNGTALNGHIITGLVQPGWPDVSVGTYAQLQEELEADREIASLQLQLCNLNALTFDEVLGVAGIDAPPDKEVVVELWLPDAPVTKTDAAKGTGTSNVKGSKAGTGSAEEEEEEEGEDDAGLSVAEQAAKAARDFYGDYSKSPLAPFVAAKASKRALKREEKARQVSVQAPTDQGITTEDWALTHNFDKHPPCYGSPVWKSLLNDLRKRRHIDLHAVQVIARHEPVKVLSKAPPEPAASAAQELDHEAAVTRKHKLLELKAEIPQLQRVKQECHEQMLAEMAQMRNAHARTIELVDVTAPAQARANMDAAQGEALALAAAESALSRAHAAFQKAEAALLGNAAKQRALFTVHKTHSSNPAWRQQQRYAWAS